MTPLELINNQCSRNEFRILKAIRVHPLDWPLLKEELVKVYGARRVSFGDMNKLISIPILMDESLVEGPVCDWL